VFVVLIRQSFTRTVTATVTATAATTTAAAADDDDDVSDTSARVSVELC